MDCNFRDVKGYRSISNKQSRRIKQRMKTKKFISKKIQPKLKESKQKFLQLSEVANEDIEFGINDDNITVIEEQK